MSKRFFVRFSMSTLGKVLPALQRILAASRSFFRNLQGRSRSAVWFIAGSKGSPSNSSWSLAASLARLPFVANNGT